MAKERRIKDPPGSIRKEQSNSSEEKYPHSKKATGIYDRFIASTGLQLILIILLPLVIYFKVVNYNFILDDETIIKNNVTSLSQLNNIGEAFKRDAFFRAPGLSLYQVYRPMQTVSFILDALISGANPWMYHFTNLLLHVLTCIALYFFLQFLNLRKITAFLGTMIYSVHPLLAGNVSWISARGDLLIGLLSILLLLTMGYYYKTNKPILFILHVLIFLAAVFTKETIIVFPVIMLMFYFLFLKTKGTDKRIIKNRDKRIIKFAAAWILIDALYFAIKMGYFPENHPATVFGIPAFIKNLDSLPAILSKVFIPISLPLFPFFDTFSVTSGLIIIVLLIYAAILLYKKKEWMPLFGITWFLIFLLPPMVFRQNNFDFIIINLEQRIYLPLIGFAIACSFLIKYLFDKKMNTGIIYISTIIIIIFSVIAYKHSDAFQDILPYTEAVLDNNSQNFDAYKHRGTRFLEMEDIPAAIENFNRAIVINPDPDIYFTLAKIKSKQGNYMGAEQDYTALLTTDPTYAPVYYERGVTRELNGDTTGAILDWKKAVALRFRPAEAMLKKYDQ